MGDKTFKCLTCDESFDKLLVTVEHVVQNHPNGSLGYFEKRFCQSTGKAIYTPVKFGLTCEFVLNKIYEGFTLKVSKTGKFFFESKPIERDDGSHGISCEYFVRKINGYLHNIFAVLKERGRLDDFLSVMESLSNGVLPPSNLSLNLLLDVGRFLCQETVHSMRYNRSDDVFLLNFL